MAKKVLKGLKGLKIFPITVNSSTVYTHGTAVPVDGMQSLTLEPDVSEWKIMADDTVYENGTDWNGMKLSLTLAELPLLLYPHFEGGTYDSTTKEYTYSSSDVAPEIGMSFMAQTSDGNYLMIRLHALRCSKVSTDLKTRGEGDSASPVTIEGLVTTRKLDNNVKTLKDSTGPSDLTWLNTLTATVVED